MKAGLLVLGQYLPDRLVTIARLAEELSFHAVYCGYECADIYPTDP
jgi:hypothetical protein